MQEACPAAGPRIAFITDLKFTPLPWNPYYHLMERDDVRWDKLGLRADVRADVSADVRVIAS